MLTDIPNTRRPVHLNARQRPPVKDQETHQVRTGSHLIMRSISIKRNIFNEYVLPAMIYCRESFAVTAGDGASQASHFATGNGTRRTGSRLE